MKKGTLLYLAQAGMIAAIYAALTYLAMALNLAYGSIQFRFSEALTILPIFTPAAVPGLAIGCLIGNLASPYPLDLVFGTAASLIAALLTQHPPRPRPAHREPPTDTAAKTNGKRKTQTAPQQS